MAQDDTLPLEADLIKVLASDTRRDILRLLNERRMTLTEMAEQLDLGKATVSEHLNKLTTAGLIERQDEGRLWIYYDLSKRGRRILNPRRTRFVLIIGASVAAAILAVGMILALQPFAGPSVTDDDTSALSVQLERADTLAGGTASWSGVVSSPTGDATDVDAFLLLPEARDHVESGRSPDEVPGSYRLAVSGPSGTTQRAAADTTGEPEAAAAADGDEGAATPVLSDAAASESGVPFIELRATSTLPPGTYYLYVRDADGRDNARQLVEVRVVAVEATVTPEVWWRGIDGSVNVQVTRDGAPIHGTLVVEPIDGGDEAPGRSLPLRKGTATIDPGTLDRLDAGVHGLRVLPDDRGEWVPLDAWFEVREPELAVRPMNHVAGEPVRLHVSVSAADRVRPVNVSVLEGTTVLATLNTSVAPVLDVGPRPAGDLTVRVGRLAERTVTIHPDLRVGIELRDGPEHHLQLTTTDGNPAEGVTVLLDDATVGVTNATGGLQLPRLADGEHVLTLQTPQGGTIERTLQVDGWNVTDPADRVHVRGAIADPDAGGARVRVDIVNEDPIAHAVDVAGLLDGAVADAETVEVNAGSNATVILSVAAASPGPHTFTVNAQALQRSPLAFENRTAQAKENGDDGVAGAPPAADADGADGSASEAMMAQDEGELTITLDTAPSRLDEIKAQAASDADQALDQRSETERALQQRSELVAEEEGAAAPPVAPILVLLAVAGVALLRRRRS